MPSTTRGKGTKKNETPILGIIDGKLPPQAVELEKAVIGALLVSPDNMDDEMSALLKPDCFYEVRHQKIYKAIMTLTAKNDNVDLFTVSEELKKTEDLEDIGGETYLAELTMNIASAAHVKSHARIIAQKYLARQLITMSMQIQAEAYKGTTDVDELMQKAEGSIFELSTKQMKRSVIQIDEAIDEALTRIQTAIDNKGKMSGVVTGFHELDSYTGGWQKSDLIIIAARPAMGKTAFVLSMAKNIAVDNRVPVAIFSLEMSNVQLVNRLIMNQCQIPGDKLRSGELEQHEIKQLEVMVKKLYNAPLYVDDTPSLSVLEFRTKARRLVREHNVGLIIIDYLQLMNASGMSFYSREQEVSLISRSLKGLAKELNIPIIALSQLNRNVESRSNKDDDDKKPQLSDLRESGAIEQDADMVCFIHRPEYYKHYTDAHGNDMRGKAQIIIAKHRSGAVGDVNLAFKSQFAQFMNLADAQAGGIVIESKANNDYASSAPIDDNDAF